MVGKTLIVGGGVTGAALARLLQDARQAGRFASEVAVWERNSIAGGRLMARSFPKQRDVHVDMGAQYWTQISDKNGDFRDKLLQSGKLVPFAQSEIAQDPYHDPAKQHAVCPDDKGFRSIVEGFLDGTPTALSHHVEKFKVLDEKSIKVVTSEGEEEIVSELVLTCPIPNVLAILKKSSSFEVSPRKLQAMEDVRYSQRFAAAYLFDQDVATQVKDLGWTAKYVSSDENEVVRFMCWDHLKKKTGEQAQPTLLVHTAVSFGTTYMDDTRHNDEILNVISTAVHEALPSLPVELDARLHRWRISQVMLPYHDAKAAEGKDSPPALVLSEFPRIVVAGDGFVGSNIDSCLLSAKAAANLLQDQPIMSGL